MFNTNKKFFLVKEEEHVSEFCEGDKAPIVEHTYENTKGEKRKVVRIFYPNGTINKQTRFYRLKDGSSDFETPCAEIEGVLGKVLFMQDGKMLDCSSQEWFKWFGKGRSEHTPNPQPPSRFNKKGLIEMQSRTKQDGESKISKEADWKKVGEVKKS